MSTFLELGVRKDFIKGLNELGIKSPTEIQEIAIPILLHSKTDLIGLAQTGTGKTAAFGLPLLQHIDVSKKEIQTLVLAPTRELVQQIQKQLFKFTKHCDARIFSEGIYGGEKIEKQVAALKRPTHIVVATPGRLIDLIERGDINIKNITTLVLDEADEMLSMGFKQDLNRILKYTEGSRNTWLFSATMPEEIKKIVKKYMSVDAARVEVNKNSLVNANITHQYINTTIKEKVSLLAELLKGRGTERGIIFCRTKAGTQNLTTELKAKGFSVEALEGDMQQRDREKVMRAFKNTSLQTLVCTDVAARGIDVNNLAYVIHHQLPEQNDYYTHRSGRTARAGKTGVSLALIIPGEMTRINELRKVLGIQFKEVFV
jgi:ATP-dependent RNA helicase DeaD